MKSLKKHTIKFFATASLLVAIIAFPLSAQESFLDEEEGAKSGSGGGAAAAPTVEWSGEVGFTTFTYLDWDDLTDSKKVGLTELRLDAEYNGENSKAVGSLEYSGDVAFAEGADTEDLINEAYFTLYYDNFDISAGYMKQVWGTTDSVHVVDVLNPIDYSRFILPDYLDRNIAEKMVKADVYIGTNGTLEMVYAPFFQPDEYALSGRWAPERLNVLYDTTVLTPNKLRTNINAELGTTTISEGQYAARYSDSAGGFDFGATYFYGYKRTPTVNNLTGEIDFNRYHLFGLEGATVISGFNLRAEAGYLMTDDYTGDDPLVHNHSVEYIAGFDRTIPLSNLSFQMQHVGSVTLNNGEIEDPAKNPATPADNQYDEDGDYTSNTITARLADNYAHDRIRVELRGSYNIEKEDYMIVPELELVLRDDASLTLSTPIFEGDEKGQFGQYSENDLLKVDFTYSF